MREAQALKPGDPCPACGGPLHPAPVPSPEQWAKFTDKDNPTLLPPGHDTASPAQRKTLGALVRCALCRYQARFVELLHAHENDAPQG